MLRRRKPDRVQGLQQTNYFDCRIEAISKQIQHQVIGETPATGSASVLKFTPFKEQERPLMFPFLISEVKTKKGGSFQQAEAQTAFPIWKLLRLQEELETQAKMRLDEQGGPLVWFLANKGEDWRLYGCYIETQETEDQEHSSSTSYVRLYLPKYVRDI